jgi:hypothetical protein
LPTTKMQKMAPRKKHVDGEQKQGRDEDRSEPKRIVSGICRCHQANLLIFVQRNLSQPLLPPALELRLGFFECHHLPARDDARLVGKM